MGSKKITDLTAVNLISGSAVLPIVQDGTTVKITFANLTGSIAGLGSSAVTASYALTAATASYAISASYEISYEVSSSYAETADLAITATSASHAVQADSALTANSATTATSASHALQADSALTADSATTATSASYAYGIRVDGLNDLSSANNVKILGISGVNMQQIDAETAIATIVSSSYAASSSLATYATTAGTALIGSGSFSGSFEGDGSGLTGISTALAGTAHAGASTIDFYTDPTTLKRDNLIVSHAGAAIGVPPASNFPLGTVVEFDIYVPTGSNWVLQCRDQAGSFVNQGFMVHGNKGFNQVDFNPQFNNLIGDIYQVGWTGYFNSYASSFGDTSGDIYHPGPALVRMVAMTPSYDTSSPTTPASGASGYFWAVRIISRQPISDSVGTNLSVEIVSTLPSSGNSTGDLVLHDAGSGMKLYFYDGSGWAQLS